MKKIILTAAAAVICIAAAGCSAGDISLSFSGDKTQAQAGMNTPFVETAQVVAASDIPEGYTVLATSECDITGNDEDDLIKLAVSAENIDGEIMWDDSQKWVLEVKTDDGRIHSLFSDRISNGNMYYQVLEDGGEIPVVQMYIMDGSSVKIERFSYNGNTFDKMMIHSETGLNVMRSSIPQYR